MRLLFKRRHFVLVSDYDYPFTSSDDFLIFYAWSMALGQEKETVDRATAVKRQADEALRAILMNHQGALGPSYQHRITSSFSQAHRG